MLIYQRVNTVWLFVFFSTFCAFGLLEGMPEKIHPIYQGLSWSTEALQRSGASLESEISLKSYSGSINITTILYIIYHIIYTHIHCLPSRNSDILRCVPYKPSFVVMSLWGFRCWEFGLQNFRRPNPPPIVAPTKRLLFSQFSGLWWSSLG